jgi:outer membrane protein OmpA-like peptidoglycan-associated protein
MSRRKLAFAAVSALLVILVGLEARNHRQSALKGPTKETPIDDSSLVALRDGSVVVARKGTVGRDMMDWLANPNRQDRYFELGGQEFDGRSIEPTIESKVRIKRLVDMLKLHSDVFISIIGFTAATSDPVDDLRLSQGRAAWLAEALHDGGVPQARLITEGRGGADPIASNLHPEGRSRNERVALFLHTKRSGGQ